jgi:flavorubredoxin
MVDTYRATPDIDVITSDFTIPGFGLLPVNAFVLKGREPLLVDTGAAVESDDFMAKLRSVIDPSELKWIWLTHTDFDHMGSLHRLLDEVPSVRLITTFEGVGSMSAYNPLPMNRVNFLNPGEKMTVGDRTLTAFKPPVYDNPSTVGFYDSKSKALFSSDCFGAIMQKTVQNAADLSAQDLREGQVFWATVDSPWVHKVDRSAFGAELKAIEQMQPELVLSSHLPMASGSMMRTLLESLSAAPGAQPFVGPDQAALEQMLKQMTEAPAH